MKYGDKPIELGKLEIECKEMMFYQYLPVKLSCKHSIKLEERLQIFKPLLEIVVMDFARNFGLTRMFESYVYLTIKRQYVSKVKSMNRPGYHSDGFLTEDINYIWCDQNPTIFNTSEFNLTLDDEISLGEMMKQALPENEIIYAPNTILRLNQLNIHKVNDVSNYEGMRTFVKVSVSKDKYNLEGNSHNYELDYKWEMIPRKIQRNIPQVSI